MSQQPQRPARRKSSLPVIAIDRIRAFARPDQLLGHREGEPRGLQVANSNALLFDMDLDDDPILLECMAKQAEQEKLAQEQKQASRKQWTASETQTTVPTNTNTNTNRSINDTSPAAIDAAKPAAAAVAEKSTATTAREEESEKRSAAIEMSPLLRRPQHNDKFQQGNELSENRVPVQAPVGSEATIGVEKRGPVPPEETKVDDFPSAGSDMDMSEDEASERSKKSRTTALVDPSPVSTIPSSTNNVDSFAEEDAIVRKLENKYMKMLNNDIIALEEKELMEKLDREICAAEEREALEKKRDSLATSSSNSLGRSREAVEARTLERSNIAIEVSPLVRTGYSSSEQLEPLRSSKAPQDNAMRVYDDVAIALEEKEWMAKLDRDIGDVEQKEKENAAAERLSRGGVSSSAASGYPEQPRQAAAVDSSKQPQPLSVQQALVKSGVPSLGGDSGEKSRYVKASKLLPRYLEGDPTCPVITQQQFQDTLVTPFVAAGKNFPGEWSGFTADLNAVPDDPGSWLLTVKGRSKVVQSFQDPLKAWVTDNLRAHNYVLLLASGVDYEVEIDKSKSIGALLSEVKNVDDCSKKAGLLIANKSEQGQLALALGLQATKCGAAVVQLDGALCSSIPEFKKLLGKEGDKKILVLRLHRDADLSESLRSARSNLPKHSNDSLISAAPNMPEEVADHTLLAHLPTVAKNVISSTMQKDADEESLEGLESNEKRIDRVARPQESEIGSVTVQGLDGKSAHSLPSVVSGKQKIAFYQIFESKFKEAAELEYKGSGIHLKFAMGQMWKQHKQKYGISCSDDCRCVFGLPFLAKNVIWEKLKAESKKPDSKWSDTYHLRVGDEPVGFIGRFAAKFIPRLQKEYQDDSSPEMLQRLIAMWELHRRNRNFGLECKESCDCSEGWELAFRRGLIPPEDKVEATARAGLGRNDSQRSSLDSGSLKRKKAGDSGFTSLMDHQTPSIKPRAEDTSSNRTFLGWSDSNSVRAGDEQGDSSATVPSSKTPASGDGHLSTIKQSVSSSDDHRRNILAKELSNHRRQSESGSSSHELSGMTNQEVTESFRGVTREPPHSTTTGARKEYDVTFDTQKPLGFFCCTDKEQQAGVTSCTIFTVSPCGQCSTDPRIQKGTSIRAAMIIGGARHPIMSFQDIRNYYNRAAAERSNLRVWFINDHVTASSLRDPSAICNEDWTSTGQWRGKHSPGWAGGARVIGSLSVSPPTGKRIRQMPTHNDSLLLPGQARAALGTSSVSPPIGRKIREVPAQNDSLVFPGQARTAISSSSVSPPIGKKIRQVSTQDDSLLLPGQVRAALGGVPLGMPDSMPERVPETDEWVILDTFRSTLVHSQPSGSSLKGSINKGEAKKTRDVRFDDAIEERQFRNDSRSYEFLVKSSGKGALPAASLISSSAVELSSRGTNSRELELFDCIRQGGFRDMLRLLANGALAESRPGKSLTQMINHLKSEASACVKQCALYPADQQLKSKKTDVYLKYLLLKIYLNASQIEHIARSLKNWVRFEIVIDRIETRLSPFAEIEGGNNVLSAGVIATYGSMSGEDLIALPSKPLSSYISYEDGNVYYMNHNTSITPERALTIHLRNELENGFSPLFLGTANLPLSHLLGKCPKAGEWCVIEEEASPTRLLLSGKVTIRARRVTLEPGYLDKKRNAERQRMKQTIKMVAGFNKEVSEAGKAEGNSHCTLPPNVTVYGGTSLLHSAVFLEDERLVKTLLDLRADLYAKGVGGQSAVALALNMADGFVEKDAGEERVDASLRMPGSQMETEIDDWRKARRARVEAVSKLLHDHVHSTPDNEKDVDTPNMDYSKGDYHHERVHGQFAATIPVAGVVDSSIRSPTMTPPSQDEMNSSATSVHDLRLPTCRDRDWIFEVDPSVKKSLLCRQWGRNGSCSHYKCTFFHVKPPPGLEIAARETTGRDGMYSAAWTDSLTSPYKAFYKTSMSSDNTRWFTAVLAKTRSFQREIFYVTGPPGFRGDDGTYWYRSEAEAKRTLKNILIVHYESECRELGIPWTPPWKQIAPTTDEAQTKLADGKPWYWCGVCSRWTISHGTNARGNIPGHGDGAGSPPQTNPITESHGFTDSFRTDSAATRSQTRAPQGYSADAHSESSYLGTRKRELHADNPYEPAPKRQAMPSSSPDANALPVLPSRHWLGKSDVRLCSFFNRAGSCLHGRSCRFEHVQDPLGLTLLKPPHPLALIGRQFALVPKAKGPDFMSHIHFKKAPGGWVTVGYRNDDLNEIYYAEGSNAGVESWQGIWWYRNENAAQSALQRVIIVATLRREKSFSKPGFRQP